MSWPGSLQARLGLGLGLGLVVVWLITAWLSAAVLRDEMNEVFDSALEETAQRILPLAVLEILDREEPQISQRMATLRQHKEFFTYLVRDDQGRVLLRSHEAEDSVFPPFEGLGFRQSPTHRLYYDAALQGSITIVVAEPLRHRAEVARTALAGLALPLVAVIPLSLIGVLLIVGHGLRPVQRFNIALSTRGAADLTAVASNELPTEIKGVAQAVNQLLARLRRTLDAERSFAANAAHELRTPVAAALAQTQRLIAQANDPATSQRARDIEVALKRLNRLAEKLMQLARAEGSRLRTGIDSDLRSILRMIVCELDPDGSRVTLDESSAPVLSDIDPDAFAILLRNLIENALRHGDNNRPVRVRLTEVGQLRVVNDGPLVPVDVLHRLTTRFERGQAMANGHGLGLAIVQAIADGAHGSLTLHSPAPGQADGFEAVFQLPRAQDVGKTAPQGL